MGLFRAKVAGSGAEHIAVVIGEGVPTTRWVVQAIAEKVFYHKLIAACRGTLAL